MAPEVVVVGSYVQDLCFTADQFPAPGETRVGVFRSGPGGKGSNQAAAAARAGARTLFIGAIGRDEFGRSAREFYRAEKIPCRWIEKSAHPTGSAAILLDRSGQNQIIVALGANLALQPDDVPPSWLRGARVVVTQGETKWETTWHVLRSARRAGAIGVLNPAPMRADFPRQVLAEVDLLIPNETEFVELLGRVAPRAKRPGGALHVCTDGQLHELARRMGVPHVILTLGAAGCFVSTPDRHQRIAGHRRIQVVDTTGAGDAFVGGCAARLARGADSFAAASFGNAVAALSVTKAGTAPAMPRKSEIEAFARDRKIVWANPSVRVRAGQLDRIKRPLEHP